MLVHAAVQFRNDGVRSDRRHRVRKLPLRQEIAPSKFDAIDSKVFRSKIKHSFPEEIRFESSRTAIRPRGRFVRNNRGDVRSVVRNTVGPWNKLTDVSRRDGSGGP